MYLVSIKKYNFIDIEELYGLRLRKFVHTNYPQVGFKLGSLGPHTSLKLVTVLIMFLLWNSFLQRWADQGVCEGIEPGHLRNFVKKLRHFVEGSSWPDKTIDFSRQMDWPFPSKTIWFESWNKINRLRTFTNYESWNKINWLSFKLVKNSFKDFGKYFKVDSLK